MLIWRDVTFTEVPGVLNIISDDILGEGLGISSSVRDISGTMFVENGEKEDTVLLKSVKLSEIRIKLLGKRGKRHGVD
jgi:hypothetical protein